MLDVTSLFFTFFGFISSGSVLSRVITIWSLLGTWGLGNPQEAIVRVRGTSLVTFFGFFIFWRSPFPEISSALGSTCKAASDSWVTTLWGCGGWGGGSPLVTFFVFFWFLELPHHSQLQVWDIYTHIWDIWDTCTYQFLTGHWFWGSMTTFFAKTFNLVTFGDLGLWDPPVGHCQGPGDPTSYFFWIFYFLEVPLP